MPFRNVSLPMAEDVFLGLSFSQASIGPPTTDQAAFSPLPIPVSDSLIAQGMRVGFTLSKIDQVNSRAASGSIQYLDLIQEVQSIWGELQSWEYDLPASMVNTPANLAYWSRKGQGHIFIFLHMNYYHLCQLLFYQFIHHSARDGECPPLAVQFATKCRNAASQVCHLIHLASESSSAELLNSLVGHVLTIASTVQLHILLFSENETGIANARHLLERNFEFLTRLQAYWPCIDISFARFKAFHEACSRSQDGSQFRMDQWMLKFLLEFATSIPERRAVDGSDDTPQYSWRDILGEL